MATFTLFPALPSELRLRIWKFALPGLSIITIYNSSFFDGGDVIFKQVPCDCSACIYPALAAASVESRALFLEQFTFCFGTHVSWKRDTIYIHQPYPTGSRDLNDYDGCYEKVYECFARTVLESNGGEYFASLALGVHWLWTYWGRASGRPFFAPFSHLKELLLVHGTVGLLTPMDKYPGFEYIIGPHVRPAISKMYKESSIFYRIPGGQSFQEANATDCTVFISDPTFVAEDFVDQLLEDEEKGTISNMPPIRVVALEVYQEDCFKDEPREIPEAFDPMEQTSDSIVFQKKWRSTC